MKVARLQILVIAIALAIVATLHLVLLASDSVHYRHWVLIQIALLGICSTLLFLSRGTSPALLAAAVAVALPAIYINSRYLNYGNGFVIWLVPTMIAVGVSWLAYRQWRIRACRSA